MGQVSYYVWLTKQFTSPINVAIPSGNFGNAYSAWFGRSNGLPINEIFCSTNVNDVLRRFIDVPLLGQIPYSEDLMLSIDKGEPLVFADGDHPISEIFIKIANSLEN